MQNRVSEPYPSGHSMHRFHISITVQGTDIGIFGSYFYAMHPIKSKANTVAAMVEVSLMGIIYLLSLMFCDFIIIYFHWKIPSQF